MSTPFSSFNPGDIIEDTHVEQFIQPVNDLEEGQAFFRDDIGTANAFKVDFSGAGANNNQISAYKKGQLVVFRAANANSAAATLQVVGPSGALNAVPVVKPGNMALASNDIKQGQIVAVVYNEDAGGANGRFEMVGAPATTQFSAAQIGSGNVSDTEFGYLDGVTGPIQSQINDKAAANHTHSASDIDSGILNSARLGAGTADSSKFLRGDSSWEKPIFSGLGDTNISAPASGDIPVFNNSTQKWENKSPTSFNSLVPVGTIVPFAGTTAPAGWLFCYGQTVSRTTYSALWDAVKVDTGGGNFVGAYGNGDGSTTFNLPDLRGRVAAGKDNMGGAAASRLTNSGTGNPGINGSTLGAAGGSDRHSLTSGQMPSHGHSWASDITRGSSNSAVFSDNTGGYLGRGFSAYVGYTTGQTGGGEAHPNVQPSLVVNYIIYAGTSNVYMPVVFSGATAIADFTNTGPGALVQQTLGGPIQVDARPLVPVGSVMSYAAANSPTGWLLCYGQNVSRTTYSELFAKLGTTFGSGDGSNTFTLPDLRGRAIAGLDNMGGVNANRINGAGTISATTLGNAGGSATHVLTSAETCQHSHTGPSHTHDLSSHTHYHNWTGNTIGCPGGGAYPTLVYGSSGGATTSGPTNNSTGAGGTGNTGSFGSSCNYLTLTIQNTAVISGLSRTAEAKDGTHVISSVYARAA